MDNSCAVLHTALRPAAGFDEASGQVYLSLLTRCTPVRMTLARSIPKTRPPGFGDVAVAISLCCCFVEPDDCSCSATNRKRMLESNPSRRLTVLQLVKSLKETDHSVLLDISDLVCYGGETDKIKMSRQRSSLEGGEELGIDPRRSGFIWKK